MLFGNTNFPSDKSLFWNTQDFPKFLENKQRLFYFGIPSGAQPKADAVLMRQMNKQENT